MTTRPLYAAPLAEIDRDPSKGWVRRMLPLLKAHRGMIVSSVSMLGVLTLAGISIPWVIKQVIDLAIAGGAEAGGASLQSLVMVLGALAVIQLGSGHLSGVWTARMTQALEYDLRAMIYAHLARLSFSFYDRAQSGQLISRANADIRALQMFLAFVPRLAVSALSFGMALGIMLVESWILALAALTTVPPVYFLGLAMRSKLFPISWVIQSRQADIATIVEENVGGVRIVKSFSAEHAQLGLLARAAQRLRWATVKQVDIRARFAPALQSLPSLSRALVLGVGGWLVLDGQTTVGALVAFNLYIVRLQAPFRMIGFLMIMAQRAAASAVRIFEILDEQPEIQDAADAVQLDAPRGELEFRRVRFGYGKGPAILDGLDLHVKPGETVALVGRTGCGKSTLARLLPRFYDVSDGAICVDGRDIRSYTVASLRAHIGMVLDEPFLFSDTLRNNIAYGRPDADLEEIRAAAVAAGADEFIQKLPKGYDTVVGERGYTLSGGQRQRVAIARTLLVNPKILILDDATSSIDVQLEHQIHDALRVLMKGRTTLIIAHRLSTIRLAERVLLLADGRIIADGTHEDLLREVKEYAEILSQAEHDQAALRARHPEPTAAARRAALARRMAGGGEPAPARMPGIGGFGAPDLE